MYGTTQKTGVYYIGKTVRVKGVGEIKKEATEDSVDPVK